MDTDQPIFRFPKSYYEITTINGRTPKKERWFCNRMPSPTNNVVVPCTSQEARSIESIEIQNSSISSSDKSENVTFCEALEKSSTSPAVANENEFSGDISSSISSEHTNQDNDSDFCPNSQSESESLDESSSVIPGDASPQSRLSTELLKSSASFNNTNISSSSKVPKRIRLKNFCLFCEESVTNFSRHLLRNHQSHLEVQRLLSHPIGSKKRKEILTALRKRGNFLNSDTYMKPTKSANINKNYLPCSHCLGFYSNKQLWRHRKICIENPSTGINSVQSDAQNFLLRNMKIDAHLREKVFPRMRADKISLVAKKDHLICAFGARYIKIHREQHFIPVASRKMRELARLLLKIQETEPSIRNLLDALKPQHFDLLVTSAKTVANYDQEKELYESPTYAINIGTSIKQCCEISIMLVLKKETFATINASEAEADLKTMIQLIDAHWKFEVSSQAADDLNIKRWNKVTIIPLASDLKQLKDYLVTKAQSAINLLNKNSNDVNSYSTLLETIFCRVILLNRKRPGELQRMLLNTYQMSGNLTDKQNYEEFLEIVSPAEKFLMNTFKRVVTRGKRGRGVPVLFSTDVQEHIAVALKYRTNFEKKKNLYLFGNPNSTEPLCGYKILKKYAHESETKNPQAITATRLRKHLATLSQVFSLSDSDMEQLSMFMGHTLGIHKQSYRLPDDVFQTAKISKLLLLMENGKETSKFKGKSLDEIQINMEENLMLDSETVPENITSLPRELPTNTTIEVEKVINNNIGNQLKICKTKRVLEKWSDEQKRIVTDYFKTHIELKKPPKKKECEELLNKNGDALRNKNWLKIKVYIQNVYSKKSK